MSCQERLLLWVVARGSSGPHGVSTTPQQLQIAHAHSSYAASELLQPFQSHDVFKGEFHQGQFALPNRF
jgi:hypothetical protein